MFIIDKICVTHSRLLWLRVQTVRRENSSVISRQRERSSWRTHSQYVAHVLNVGFNKQRIHTILITKSRFSSAAAHSVHRGTSAYKGSGQVGVGAGYGWSQLMRKITSLLNITGSRSPSNVSRRRRTSTNTNNVLSRQTHKSRPPEKQNKNKQLQWRFVPMRHLVVIVIMTGE